MKRIGILTWHYLDNYGSVLQAYALQSYLTQKKYNVQLINYRKDSKTGVLAELLRCLKYNILYFKKKDNRKSKFYKFRKSNLNETKMYNSYNQLKNEKFYYDKVICGSDQIWAQKRFDDVYFLSFLNNKKVKKYSYAASTMEEYSLEQQKKLVGYLDDFSLISVREKKGVEIIQKYTNKKVEEVLDPTLLLNKEQWTKIIKNSDNKIIPKNKYVLCYFVGNENKYEEIANLAKEKYACDEIINIEIMNTHHFGKIVKNASPTEFLNLFENATTIVTDSYHGVLFSINLEKEFIAVKRFDDDKKDNQNERVYNILKNLGLEERCLGSEEKLNFRDQINYTKVNRKLDSLREKSYKFLQNIISEDCND